MMMMIIAIDAGHGPETAGKRSPDGTLREYQFNSAVADEMEKLLSAYKCSFFRTDEKNSDVALTARTNEANTKKATLFISIHANAVGNDWSASGGIETLIRDGDPTSERYREDFAIATAVQRRLVQGTKLRDRQVKQRKDLHILNASRCPTILVEAGFMTNRAECNLLKSPAYRKLVADCIVKGVIDVYKLAKK